MASMMTCGPCLPDKEAMNDPWNFRMWDFDQKYFFFENNVLIAAPLYSMVPGIKEEH
uniref:Uncharacterized protein n=1 Tax=Pseudonaja textilis TaxID=8673 RepID=A0A670YU56_PSETE